MTQATAELVTNKDCVIAVYNEFRSQLAQLGKENASLVFDYASPKGNKEARSHLYKLRQTKTAVDKARESEKRASLDYGRKVDAEAKEIISKIEEMITVHETPLKAIEEREAARVQGIRNTIESIRLTPASETLTTSEKIRDALFGIKAIEINEAFAEFTVEAAQVKDAAVSAMEKRLAETEKREVEAAELERLRKEAAERAQKDRDEQIRSDAEKKAIAAAEAKAKAELERAEAKAKQEREAGERRELELKLAAERAEREKIAAQQRAERAAKDAEERLRRDAEEANRKEAEATAKREADKKHKAKINNAAASAFVKGGMDEEAAKLAVTLIAKGSVPAIEISY